MMAMDDCRELICIASLAAACGCSSGAINSQESDDQVSGLRASSAQFRAFGRLAAFGDLYEQVDPVTAVELRGPNESVVGDLFDLVPRVEVEGRGDVPFGGLFVERPSRFVLTAVMGCLAKSDARRSPWWIPRAVGGLARHGSLHAVAAASFAVEELGRSGYLSERFVVEFRRRLYGWAIYEALRYVRDGGGEAAGRIADAGVLVQLARVVYVAREDWVELPNFVVERVASMDGGLLGHVQLLASEPLRTPR